MTAVVARQDWSRGKKGVPMGLYQDRVLPHLIHFSMRNRELLRYRERVVSAAAGRVLEIGVGSGLNLPFYGAGVERVIGLDPSPRLLTMARKASHRTPVSIDLLEGTAEAIPLEARSVDTVVTAWTMCSIPDPPGALAEMRRVLRPGGRLLFVEHGRAPDRGVQWCQDLLNPVWRRIAGGCNLNRRIDELVRSAGFRIEHLETGYIRGPRAMTFLYEGSASPA